MKKFLIRLLLFCLLFIVIDRCFIILRNYSSTLEIDKRLERIINKEIKDDILIFGSSRGARNIIAKQIQDSLDVSSYNLSYPGGNIEYQLFILKQVLKYHKPKIIVVAIDDNTELATSVNVNYRYDRLYPLVKYEVVREELIRKGEKNKYLSDFFILHQLSKSNFDIRPKKFTEMDTIMSCGSMPIDGQTKTFKKEFSTIERKYEISKEFEYKRKSFIEFMELCNKAGIKLLLVFPPNYFKPCIPFYQRIESLSKDKAYILKYDINKYHSDDLFNDENHLQRKGAVVFTDEIIQYIKKENLLISTK